MELYGHPGRRGCSSALQNPILLSLKEKTSFKKRTGTQQVTNLTPRVPLLALHMLLISLLGALASSTVHRAHMLLTLHLRRPVAAAELPPGPPQPGLKSLRPLLLAPPHPHPAPLRVLHVVWDTTAPAISAAFLPLLCFTALLRAQPAPGSSQFLSPKLSCSVKLSERL